MLRLLLCLLVAALACAAVAQDESIDIGVAFPSTTMVYVAVDDTRLGASAEFNELMASLTDVEGFTLKDVLVDRLELKLADTELAALQTGIKRTAAALLDVAVSGPKFQFVFEHSDLSALARALKQGHADAIRAIPGVKDHFGTPVYSLYFAPRAQDIQPGGFNMNPMSGWMNQEEFWASIYDNRYLVLGNSFSAVSDAVDFLSFPEDTVDTLLSSARYREAISEFKDPHALLYVSVESIITAVERLSGDQGGSPMWQFIPFFMGDMGGEGWSFFVRLLQYEQFKSAAAAMWLDEETSTLRMDFGFSFHNPPGWYEALRIPPAKRPFADMIPADATLALTECVQDPMALYNKLKEFVLSRARNAGQGEFIKAWEEWEEGLVEDRAGLEELLSHLGGEQGLVLLSKEGGPNVFTFNPVSTAVLLSVKDIAAAEDYLFEKLLPSKLGAEMRAAEGALTPVEVYGGIEIHHAGDGSVSFALMARDDGSGVFLFGESHAIKRIVDARANGGTVDTVAAWQTANSMLPETSSIGAYVNVGGVIHVVGTYTQMMQRWWMEEEAEDGFNRDDTEKDADPVPYLAEFFGGTVIVGGAHSETSSMRARLVAAGWPSRVEMTTMTTHFSNVKRNGQVRDDLLQIREAAFVHFAIQGAPPDELEELIQAGYIRDRETTLDAFHAEPYKLAPVPADVDSRQAVLLAYQGKPGLRDLHLAVLWNSHVVALRPEQLAEAIERAGRGEALKEERYSEPLRELYRENLRPAPIVHFERESTEAELVIIDEDGNERELGLEKAGLREQTEQILDQMEAGKEEAKEEPVQDEPVEDPDSED